MRTRLAFIQMACLVLLACSDGTPAAPTNGVQGSPEPGGDDSNATTEEQDGLATNKYVECAGEDCVGGFAFGRISYVVFEDASQGLDPARDDYVVVPGTFDITAVPKQDDEPPVTAGTGPDGTLYPDMPLPFDLPLGLGFERQLTMDFHVVDLSGTYPDIDCNIAIYSDGFLSGALVREPGVMVCSTHNWEAPQDPGEPGLLIDYALCNGPGSAPCAY